MEPEREPKIGSCYECCIKEDDSSQRQVYYCELCGKWFCERHREPKFPYFVDWDTVFDVQGNPEIKLLFHTEYRREGGHPDFVYWRRTFEALNIEEEVRNKLIQQAIDRMAEAIKLKTEIAIDIMDEKMSQGGKLETYENKFHNRFSVPKEVYSNRIYRDRLNNANTLGQVNSIVLDYYKNQHKEKQRKRNIGGNNS